MIVPGLSQKPAFDLDIIALPQPPVRHNPFLRMPELPAMFRNYASIPVSCKPRDVPGRVAGGKIIGGPFAGSVMQHSG